MVYLFLCTATASSFVYYFLAIAYDIKVFASLDGPSVVVLLFFSAILEKLIVKICENVKKSKFAPS